jgi:prepilin-type N-terminal cleavage/methylation domain-containing protein
MPTSRPNDDRRALACARANERGFSMIELIVALIIVAILGSIAVITFSSSRSAVSAKEGIATGSTYLQAISQYQADHGNMTPTAAQMRPAGAVGTVPARALGPANLLDKTYVASVPDSVAAGRVGVSMDGANCAGGMAAITGAAKQSSWVSYCRVTDSTFGIRIASRANGGASWTDAKASLCWMGNAASATPRCK